MSDHTPPPDPLELLKRMWAPMSLPLPGMVVPLANAADVEKRIADLKSVEHWLTLNLNVVKMSIQGLEMQHATLAALQSAQESLAQRAGKAAGRAAQGAQADGTAGAPPNPFEAWWSLLQPSQPPAAQQSPVAPPASKAPPSDAPRSRSREAGRRQDGGKKGR